MRLKIVLVRPIYPENVGLVARAAANFSCKELALVKPKCSWKTGKAKSRAMHGKYVLLKAKEFDSIAEATKDCSYAIATSARKGRNRNTVSAKQLAERLGRSRARVALVFGSEPSGLTNEEIAECDLVASISASKTYATLNLSHAVCLILYQLFTAKRERPDFAEAKPATKRLLLKAFEKDLQLLPSIDDKGRVFASFKALAARALLSEKEALALVAFLSETRKALVKGKRRND